MDPIDKELKEGLTDGPLGRQDGFSDSLKKRIEKRIEENVKPRRARMPWFAGACVVLAAAACFLLGDPQRLLPHQETSAATQNAGEPLTDIQYYAEDPQAVPVQSALLIGLRTDEQNPQIGEQFSTYRTLLIAPDQNRLQTIAEGSGILMPYKMSFWKIVSERRESAHEEARTLAAYLTSAKPAARQPVVPPVKPLIQSEKLLFAGNRYMAVEQTVNDRSPKEGGTKYEYVWVKELDQIAGRAKPTMAPLQEPHVSLRSLYGAATTDPAMQKLQPALPVQPGETAPRDAAATVKDKTGESWTITRRQGQWVAQVADYSVQTSPKEHRYELKDFPATLPESVVSHDRLAAGWQEIKRLRPSASDAFSSPAEDMIAIVSEREVVIYPYQQRLIPSPLMSFSLGRNETVVMVQWAVGDYVEQWKQQAKMYLAQE